MPEVSIHGRRFFYREAGDKGPTVLLVHGITNSSATWAPVTERLAARGLHVLAPDIAGHGDSDRQRGDHSLGAHASILRDFLSVKEVDRATIVGHSLGGGLVMQFSYQFPEMSERMVLVASGGLGREVSLAIRAGTLPFAEEVLGVATSGPVTAAVRAVGGALGRVGIKPGGDIEEILRGLGSLSDGERRHAFVRTAKSVITPRGQRVAATDKLYLAVDLPTLLVAGAHDHVIPAEHTRAAGRLVPGSRLAIFENSGHFPHLNEPDRFADLLAAFVKDTKPARYDRATARRRIVEGPPQVEGGGA
ncbi:MAG TPA: alpha/beta hydrolase [Thermoleophilaceae bacterium]|nr:alpha/beta hydrolase [Thermoleophilaceae bacterium]